MPTGSSSGPPDLAGLILELCHRRGNDRTICPSEVARTAGEEDWRLLMPAVRDAAASLADAGEIEVTQRGRRVDPRAARGPIRLGLAKRSDGAS